MLTWGTVKKLGHFKNVASFHHHVNLKLVIPVYLNNYDGRSKKYPRYNQHEPFLFFTQTFCLLCINLTVNVFVTATFINAQKNNERDCLSWS
jgi:hypothetical protein